MKPSGFDRLRAVMLAAADQAENGKGRERHGGDTPFERQPIFWIAESQGLGFLTGQAIKKIDEMQRIREVPRKIAELRGALVYVAVAIIMLENACETQNSKEESNGQDGKGGAR